MLERILIPLDGSPLAEAILAQVRPFLRRNDSEVILLHVVVPPSGGLDMPLPLHGPVREAGEYVDARVRGLEDQGVRARGRVCVGPAAETILGVAKEERATLIAMSTHGRSGISRWVFGSVAEKVVRSSPVPVMVMRAARTPQVDTPLRNLLVPIDGSERSLAAVPSAKELARLFGARVALLHVIEEGEGFLPPPEVERALNAAVEDLGEAGVKVTTLLRRGDPATEILDVCGWHAADLIVMSTHGRSGFSRLFFGSVAEKVLRASPVPVLAMREIPVEAGAIPREASRSG